MSFSERSKIGKILLEPAAAEVLVAAVPEIINSPHLDLIKAFSLERMAGFLGQDREWIAALVSALNGVPIRAQDDKPERAVPFQDIEDGPRSSARISIQPSVPLWGTQELTLEGPATGNPFREIDLQTVFSCDSGSFTADGFYDGDGVYRVRFMPNAEGTWSFRTSSNALSLDGIVGSFICTAPTEASHGPVQISGTFHFSYADGTPYRPFGTTLYAWTHQDEVLEQQTLDTLSSAPFNKVRMCVFPKAYEFNENEPPRHAFDQADGRFDLDRFNPQFFQHLEERIADLGSLGIQADLILFHPYDRWGYAELPADVEDRYVRYVVARLGAYANVWWSLANEYDLLWRKDESDWERLGTLVHASDPHDHLISVHQCFEFFDHSKSWVTHCSLQRVDNYRTAENTTEWRNTWRKPAIIDECAYEGDIDMIWGNITGAEMTRRFWEGTVRGGYLSHGETYQSPDDVLWWSKGGELKGESVSRIAFLRSVLERGPHPVEPIPAMSVAGYPTAGKPGEYYLQYLGFFQPRWHTLELPAEESYRVEILDTWHMTITDAGIHRGTFRVRLPGQPYMAIRLQREH